MKIVLKKIEYGDDSGEESVLEAEVEKIDEPLVKIINGIAPEVYSVLYYDGKSCKDIIRDGTFIFILKDGHYEWYVPVEEVSVRDFINTYNICENESITFYEEVLGGGGIDSYISDIIDWIPLIIQSASYVLATKDIIKGALSLYKKLIGRNNKVASLYDFGEMLKSKETWSISELKQKTSIKDDNLLEIILMNSGFKKMERVTI